MNKMGADLWMEGMQVCVFNYSCFIHHYKYGSLSWGVLWESFCVCKEQQFTLRLLYPFFLSKYIQALRESSL